tara:strand:- start:11039 stop:11461 length:423 start_codon:yes stop_codon:yes gene_type:complete
MEEYVITLTNGVRVLNLRGNEVRFTDGTIAPRWDSEVQGNFAKRIRSINVLPDEDLRPHLVETLGKEVAKGVTITDSITIPREEDFYELKKNIPNDCLVLVGGTTATAYGLPFVDTCFAKFDDDNNKIWRIDLFRGTKPV